MSKYISIDRTVTRGNGKGNIIRLDSVRKSDIRGLLDKRLIDWENVYVALSTATIEATDRPERMETYTVVFAHRGPLSGKKHTETSISTRFEKIYVQYYEYWQETENNYILERIYINFIYKINDSSHSLFSIHVDPMKKTRFSEYEAMPHYHFYLTPRPLSKIHVPLDLLTGLKSTEDYPSLKKVLMASVKAIAQELETRHRLEGTKIEKFLRAFNASEQV